MTFPIKVDPTAPPTQHSRNEAGQSTNSALGSMPKITEVRLQIAGQAPPLALLNLEATSQDLQVIATEAWKQHVPEGLVLPQHSKQAYAARFTLLRDILPPGAFARIKEEQATLGHPPSIFDEARLPLAALTALQAQAPFASNANLAHTLTPRFVEAIDAIASATSPTQLFAAITVLKMLVEACPALPATVDRAAIRVDLHSFLRDMDHLAVAVAANSAVDYRAVLEGCFKTIELLAPCFDVDDVRVLVPFLSDAAATDVGRTGHQGWSLDALTALLRRVADLDLPRADLVQLRNRAFNAIAQPYVSQQSRRQTLVGHAWCTLHALVEVLTDEDVEFARSAVGLVVTHLSPYWSTFDSTKVERETMETLGRVAPEYCIQSLRPFARVAVDLASRAADDDAFDTALSGLKVLCLAVGGPTALQAIKRVIAALPAHAVGPNRTADFIFSCAPLVDSATARSLWNIAFLNECSWGNGCLDTTLAALAPRLSDKDAAALLKQCIADLEPMEDECRYALCALQALSTRVSDHTPFARECVACIESLVTAMTAENRGRRGPLPDSAWSAMAEACMTLGSMSHVQPSVLLTIMNALLKVSSHGDVPWDVCDASDDAMCKIICDASPTQLPLLRSIMENLGPEHRRPYSLLTVWSAYIARLHGDAEVESACRAFAQGLTLSERIDDQATWDLAALFVERLKGQRRDAWINEVLACAKDLGRCISESHAFLRTQPAWSKCMTSIIRHGSDEQRTEALEILDTIRSKSSGEIAVDACIASGETSPFADIWPSVENSLLSEGYNSVRQALTKMIQEGDPAFVTRMLTRNVP